MYDSITAQFVFLFVKPFIHNIAINTNTIYLDKGILIILFGCSGLESIFLFSSAILSLKNNNKLQKILWFIFGNMLIYGFNLIRIILLAILIEYNKNYFRFFHDYLSQGLFIMLVFGIFFIYVKKIKKAQQCINI